MRSFITLLVSVLMFGSLASAQVKAPATLKMKIGIGMGYQLCPQAKATPTLQDAFLCPGLLGVTQTVELTLVNKPAAKPTWLFYEAPYTQTITFNNVTVKMDALVMYAKLDGLTMGYVDGQIVSTQNGKDSAPVYFRASAEGGLDKLSYSSAFGSASPIVLSDKSIGQFSPYVVVDAAR